VKITVEGKYTLLRKFDADNVAAIDLNLSGYESGQVTFDPELFKLPPDLQVREVRPAAMVVRFEARVQRALPIEARFEGEPQTGYRVTQVTVDPPEATVVGAQSVVEALEKVQTERISLVGRSQTTTIDVPLSAPPAYASYRDRGRRYGVTLTIEEKRSTRLVSAIPVEVRGLPPDAPGFEVSPPTVDITLHGPMTRLSALKTDELLSHVDASKLGDGKVHSVQVRVDPPEGLTVQDIEPNQVTLVRVTPPPPDAGPPDAEVKAPEK
ncbi:MAG: YbbR-like domain-containing protein, partial [Myxococcales bacterium]|nr:YbbR-like domain-containing protein [Myxococcales bacterium]